MKRFQWSIAYQIPGLKNSGEIEISKQILLSIFQQLKKLIKEQKGNSSISFRLGCPDVRPFPIWLILSKGRKQNLFLFSVIFLYF